MIRLAKRLSHSGNLQYAIAPTGLRAFKQAVAFLSDAYSHAEKPVFVILANAGGELIRDWCCAKVFLDDGRLCPGYGRNNGD